MTLDSSVINNNSNNSSDSSGNNATSPKKNMSKEEEAQFWKPFEDYPLFPHFTSKYCEYCTDKCRLYCQRKNFRKIKGGGSQTTLPKRIRNTLDYEQYMNQQKIAKKVLKRIRIDLSEDSKKCANKRLYKYVKLGHTHLFNFPKDLNNLQKPRLKSETKSSKDCCNRIEIRCTQRREPVDFCICSIQSEDNKNLIAFLKENKNECSCNETSKKHCPYIYSCEDIIARKQCPETIDRYS